MNDCEFSYVFWLRNMALDLDEVDQVLITWDWISSCNPEIETYEHLVIWSKICRLCMCACPCGRSSQERTRRDSWSVNMVPKSQQSSRFQLGFHLEWTVSMETPLLTNLFLQFFVASISSIFYSRVYHLNHSWKKWDAEVKLVMCGILVLFGLITAVVGMGFRGFSWIIKIHKVLW